ncbi:MAG: radical SAM protein [Desulfobacula sp.]|uniref:radical SAM protein n=1 Tax=Desulfobacula sp. TaxID=2593537 RepID=UPI0025C19928|nr:radical SAM protein [Desulfobacula sp.]MCD4719837.1 radical SAM protein [Desulfobacula sp.]
MKKKKTDIYKGFEQGPIRPPSEASSLLIRVTRNCPWNRCTFCRVYKKRQFSLRSVENVIKDIDSLQGYIKRIQQIVKPGGYADNEAIHTLSNSFEEKDRVALNAAMNWYATGMKSIFLQDANSLIMKPNNLVFILEHIKKCFPNVDRITSYARSHTIVRIKQDDLQRIADAGLNRIHVGMESGSDTVLKKINKGVTKAGHIKAGLKVKEAGMELSEYVMPGLGGIDYSIEHAMETASALNSINPEFIRIRTLAVTNGTVLAVETEKGEFQKPNDTMMAKELRLFIESLDGIDSYIKSDHILNLFETIDGKMPEDKEKMINIIDRFFELEPEKRVLYQIGRRMGFFRGPDDMDDSPHLERVRQACDLYGVTPDNVDVVIDDLMKRFV